MLKLIFASFLMVLITIVVTASFAEASDIEPIDPASTCERFLDQSGLDQCQTLIRKISDSYLASLCNQQFSNTGFLDCLSAAQDLPQLSPKKISSCHQDNMTDQERIQCVGQLKNTSTQRSKRLPASLPNKVQINKVPKKFKK